MAAELPRAVLMTADTVGGVWQYALELAGGLCARGVKVVLAAMGAATRPDQRRAAGSIKGLILHERPYRLEWMSDPWADVNAAGEWLLELEAQYGPDVVHANQFAFGALPFSAPRLVVAHSCVRSWWRAVYGTAAPAEWGHYGECVRNALCTADLVVAPSRGMLAALAEEYGCEFSGRMIPNGRSAAAYTPGEKAPFVLSAGRFWDDAKNLAALEAVAPRLPWPVRVAGSTRGPDGSDRRPTAVSVLGELGADALAAELRRAAIYALPARYEPFGLSVLEAALSGCALVLGDIPSLRENWEHAAVFVPPHDHAALEHALNVLMADESARERLGRAARERAVAFTPERFTSAYLDCYAQLLGDAPRAIAPHRARTEREKGLRACAS